MADKPRGVVLAFGNDGLIYGLSVCATDGVRVHAMLGRNTGNTTRTSGPLPKCVAIVVGKPRCNIFGCSRRLISHSIGSCFNSRSTWNERARPAPKGFRLALDDIKKLIDAGKEKGYVAYKRGEITLIPHDVHPPESLDDLLSTIGTHGKWSGTRFEPVTEQERQRFGGTSRLTPEIDTDVNGWTKRRRRGRPRQYVREINSECRWPVHTLGEV